VTADPAPDLLVTVDVLVRGGRLADAVRACRQALAEDPGSVAAFHCLCMLLSGQGQWAEALDCARKALSLAPDHFAATLNAGMLLGRLGRADEALETLKRAVALAPGRFEAHQALGNAHAAAGRHGAALASFRQALALAPADPGCANNLGATLLNLGCPQEAEAILAHAHASAPYHEGIAGNLAEAWRVLDRLDAAEALCRELMAAEPQSAVAHRRLGMVRADGGQLDDAIALLRRAVELAPDEVETHIGLALALLAAGRYGEGWREYEWRRRLPAWRADEPPLPGWGGEGLDGRAILLWGEQGIGDSVQFLRFAPAVKALGATVLLKVDAALGPLAAGAAGIDRLAGDGSLPPADCQASLHSLPVLLGVTLDSLPPPLPPPLPEAARQRWRSRLAPVEGLRVGLAWAGNAAHRLDTRRSLPPEALAVLDEIPGLEWINLQLGPRRAEFGGRGWDFADHLTDLAETAALIAELDVVVTVDTVIAHLAGTMGRPVLLLLPLAAEWRWLRGRADSPWYPSVRLFRQQRPGDWAAPLAEVRDHLREMTGRDHG